MTSFRYKSRVYCYGRRYRRASCAGSASGRGGTNANLDKSFPSDPPKRSVRVRRPRPFTCGLCDFFFFFTFMANVSGVCRVVSGHSSRMSLSFKLPPLILRKLLYFFSGLLFLTSPRDPPHPFNTHFFGSSDFNNSFHPPNLPSPPRVVNSHSPEPSKLHSVCLPGN